MRGGWRLREKKGGGKERGNIIRTEEKGEEGEIGGQRSWLCLLRGVENTIIPRGGCLKVKDCHVVGLIVNDTTTGTNDTFFILSTPTTNIQ